MEQLIAEFVKKAVRTAYMEDSVEKVEDDLTFHRMHAVPVVDAAGTVFGIISEADLLHFHANGKNPKSVRAWELCTYKPVCVAPATPAAEVARMMVTHKIHQVLVADGASLVGIVSTFDLLEHYLQAEARIDKPAGELALA
jgi:CBS domain-containing protein